MTHGAALAEFLLGRDDASGRLPTTFPRRLEDSPAVSNYPGTDGVVAYGEGIFVGYRHYDRAGIEPRFCFGHGLSYTTFAYANLVVQRAGDGVSVHVEVANTGQRPGSEVVQLYVRDLAAAVEVPE